MTPAVKCAGMDKASPIPMRAIPIVATVVHEVPVITDITDEIMQAQGRKNVGVIICTP